MPFSKKMVSILDFTKSQVIKSAFQENFFEVMDLKEKDFTLSPNEILEVRYDRLFHDRVKVGNTRLVNKSLDDKQKFVDSIAYHENMIYVIELNNNFKSNYLRNVLYILNAINNSYIEGEKYYDTRIQGILVSLIVNLSVDEAKEIFNNKKN